MHIGIECSCIHRSLGSHISKVRSLTLDTLSWTPAVISSLRNNGQSNAIYEAKLISLTPSLSPSAAPIFSAKPNPTDRRDVKAKFIHAKYVDKLYMVDGVQDTPAPTPIAAATLVASIGNDLNSRESSQSTLRASWSEEQSCNDLTRPE